MGLFKSKDEKETAKLEKLNEKMAQYGLEDLSDEDKERVKNMLYLNWGTTLVSLGASAEDSSKINLLELISNENLMIIKLLNEISQKLDK